MTREISNHDEVIDSRDIIKRIEELEGEQTDHLDSIANVFFEVGSDFYAADILKGLLSPDEVTNLLGDVHEAGEMSGPQVAEAIKAAQEWQDWEADNAEELDTLRELADEASGSPDWEYGETLIRDSYFREYAHQLAEDCGMLHDTDTWPNRCIDWDQAADELKEDYFYVDFDGVEYWIRA
jgi:hypothetical protein